MDKDAAFLRALGFGAKDGVLTFDEQQEAFKDDTRKAVLNALDGLMASFDKPDKGWTDADLPNLFKAVDAHAENLFTRHHLLNAEKTTP